MFSFLTIDNLLALLSLCVHKEGHTIAGKRTKGLLQPRTLLIDPEVSLQHMIHNLRVLDSNRPPHPRNRHRVHPSVLCEVTLLRLKEIRRGGRHHLPKVTDQWETRGAREVGTGADKEDRTTVFIDRVEDDGEEEFFVVGVLGDEG